MDKEKDLQHVQMPNIDSSFLSIYDFRTFVSFL